MENLQLTCQYCQYSFHVNDIVSHLDNHYAFQNLSSHYCKLCNVSLSIDTPEIIIDHMINNHGKNQHCPFCEKFMKNLDNLYYHLKANTIIIYHCKSLNCIFMTSDPNKLKQHLSEMKHKMKNVSKEYNINCIIKDVMKPIDDEESKMFNNGNLLKRKTNGKDNFDYFDNTNTDVADENYKTNISQSSGKEKILNAVRSSFKMQFSKVVLKKLFKHRDKEYFNSITSKLENIESYMIGISTIEGKNATVCMTCGYFNYYGSVLVRKHILTRHCKFKEIETKLIIKSCKYNTHRELLPDREMISIINQERLANNLTDLLSDIENSDENKTIKLEKNNTEEIEIIKKENSTVLNGQSNFRRSKRKVDNNNQHVGEIKKVKNTEEDCKSTCSMKSLVKKSDVEIEWHKMEYSKVVLQKCFENQDPELFKTIASKLANLGSYEIGVKTFENSKNYICKECEYMSIYCRDHIRHHILTKHCKLDKFQSKMVVMSCRINSEWELLSDDAMIERLKGSLKHIQKRPLHVKFSIDSQILRKKFPEKSNDSIQCSNESLEGETVSARTNETTEIKEIILMDYNDDLLMDVCKKQNKLNYNDIKVKLQDVQSHSVGKVMVEEGTYFMCMSCKYTSKYSVIDVKMHILSMHCQLSFFESKVFMTASLKNDNLCNDKKQENHEVRLLDTKKTLKINEKTPLHNSTEETKPDFSVTSNKMSKWITQNGTTILKRNIKKIFFIEYSKSNLRTIFSSESPKNANDIISKLENLKSFSIGLAIVNNCTYFVCMECNFSTQNSSYDVRRHILRRHCNLGMTNTKLILLATKYDNDLEMSDQNITSGTKNGNLKIESKMKPPSKSDICDIENEVNIVTNEMDNGDLNMKNDSVEKNEHMNVSQRRRGNQTFKVNFSKIILEKLFANGKSLEEVLVKLNNVETFSVSITRVKRIKMYICVSCNYSVTAKEGIIMHILAKHCKLDDSEITLALPAFMCNDYFNLYSDGKILELIKEKKEVKDDEIQHQFENVKENEEPKVSYIHESSECVEKRAVCEIKKVIYADYSERVLRKVLKHVSGKEGEKEEMVSKLRDYKTYSVGLVDKADTKYFICMSDCQYSSENISEMWKHILAIHFKVTQKYWPAIVHSLRCGNGFEIMSDRILIEMFNQNRPINCTDLLSDSEDETLS